VSAHAVGRRCTGCGFSLQFLRTDAKWCSDACRKRTLRHLREQGIEPDRVEAFWAKLGQIQRPSRPGRFEGARARNRPVHSPDMRGCDG